MALPALALKVRQLSEVFAVETVAGTDTHLAA